MFMVYSPEGRQFLGESTNKSSLKITPTEQAHEIHQIKFDDKASSQDAYFQTSANQDAMQAYEKVQSQNERQVIVQAREIMSAPVVTIEASQSLEEAWRLMTDKQIKHLPVMRQGELVGMCSQTQLLNRLIVDSNGQLEGVKPEAVAEVMKRAISTGLHTEIRHLAKALDHYESDALVVMSDLDQIVGLVSASDLIHRLANEPPLELYT